MYTEFIMNRINIPDLLQRTNCQGIIISHPANIAWATGFVSSNSLLYIDNSGMTIITDSRYSEAAKKLSGVKVVLANQESLAATLKKIVKSGTNIGYQPEFISSLEFENLQKTLEKVKLIPIPGILKEQIANKTDEEIALIEKAQRIAETVLQEVIGIFKEGITEKEIAAEIIYRQMKNGADGISPEFWPIVAFGANSALPHAHPGDTKLEFGDVVLLDYGCTVGGYCSDMTRTFAYGSAPDKFREVYNIVLKAQEAGITAIKAGKKGKEIDRVVRDAITKAGYGDKFGHGTGHGVGIEIHEWPTIGPNSDYVLPVNSVITIEPGIYLPGEFGVRIEDMLVIQSDGARNLTNASKKLTIINP
jgi:Xaa-Pro aminopeptidase